MEKPKEPLTNEEGFDFVERTLIVFIVVFLALCVAVVAEAAYPKPVEVGRSYQDWRPSIPHCDKDTWSRIKDRCAE